MPSATTARAHPGDHPRAPAPTGRAGRGARHPGGRGRRRGRAAVAPARTGWPPPTSPCRWRGRPTGPWVEARAAVVRRGRTTLVVEAGIFDVDGRRHPPTAADAGRPGERRRAGGPRHPDLGRPPGPARRARVPPDRDLPDGAGPSAAPGSTGRSSTPSPSASSTATPGRLSMPRRALPAQLVRRRPGRGDGPAGEWRASPPSSRPPRPGPSRRRAVVTDLQVAYLALGRVGPIISRAPKCWPPSADGGRAVVELVDEGAGRPADHGGQRGCRRSRPRPGGAWSSGRPDRAPRPSTGATTSADYFRVERWELPGADGEGRADIGMAGRARSTTTSVAPAAACAPAPCSPVVDSLGGLMSGSGGPARLDRHHLHDGHGRRALPPGPLRVTRQRAAPGAQLGGRRPRRRRRGDG